MDLAQRLKIRFGRLRVRWKWFANSPFGERLLWVLRQAVTAGVVGYLVYRLWTIGWVETWQSVPETPWFYILFVGLYLTLPVFQALIFSILWDRPMRVLFPPMLKKRVYNKDVMSYSGEMYLYLWTTERHSPWSDVDVMHSIKDNAIMSSVANTSVALCLLGGFLLTGTVALPELIAQNSVAYGIGGGLIAAVIAYAAIKFRRTVFGLAPRLLAVLFGLHVCRLLLVQALQILQWNVVIPEISLAVWFTFLAAQIVVQGIPLLPSRDLLFATAGIEMAGAMDIPQAAIAGLFIVQSVLDKGVNLMAFVAATLWDHQLPDESLPDAEAEGHGQPTSVELPDTDDSPARLGSSD